MFVRILISEIEWLNRLRFVSFVFFSDFFKNIYFGIFESLISACVNCPSHSIIFPKTGCKGGNSVYYAGETECDFCADNTVWNGGTDFLQ